MLEPFTGPNDPFWRDYGVSVTTMLFAGVLAVFAALIAGMLPAFQATGRLAVSGLHTLGGRTSMRLGATWTALVWAQIAFSVAVLPSAVEYGWGMMRPGVLGPGFAPEEYLTARLMLGHVAPLEPTPRRGHTGGSARQRALIKASVRLRCA